MPKPDTIFYQNGRVFTPDDFEEPPQTQWGFVFSEPVTIQQVVKALGDADLPIIEFRSIKKESP